MKEKMKLKRPRDLPCDACDGSLKQTVLTNFDFSKWAGLPVTLETVPGYRCDTCGGQTLPGVVVNLTLGLLAIKIVQLPHRLPAQEARYLRRSLQITQQELADRMGVARETVAQWECGEKEISPQHDLILRTILLNRFFGESRVPPELLTATMSGLVAVKSDPPPRKRRPLVVPKENLQNAAYA